MLERYKSLLLELFTAIQQLNASRGEDRLLCKSIQEVLLQKITHVERRIRQSKAQIVHARHLLRGGAHARLSKEEAQEVKDAISYYHSAVDNYQHILILLHQIGDAIAFTYLDKWDIKPMAFRQAPGFISGKKGTRLERGIMRKMFERGCVAILNDLTTCLRHGDITIPLGGPFIVVEAKSGRGRTKRDINQKADIEKVVHYVLSDRTENLFGYEGILIRHSLSVHERNHIGWLNQLIIQARRRGEAARQVEKGLHYIVAYSDDNRLLMRALQSCGSPPMVGFVNTYKYNNNGYYPFTLSIRDPVALYDFYAGSFLITVIVDPSVLESEFASKGYRIEFVNDEYHAFTLTNPKLPFRDNKVAVGQHFWRRVYTEFLSMHWYVEELSQRFTRLDLTDFDPSDS